MNSEELKTLALRLAALTDMLEERCGQAVGAVSESSDQLQRTAKGLGLEGQRLASEAVSTIGAQANDVIRRGLQQAVDQCSMQLQQVVQQAAQTTATLHEQGATLRQIQRGLVWKAALALMVGSVLATGGSGYLMWRSLEAVRQADFSTALVHATRSGVLTECDGVLCVKAHKSAARYAKNGDYILLKE